MQQTTESTTLADFVDHRLMPTVFQRLDRVFPEFRWTLQEDGWVGRHRGETVDGGRLRGRRVVCKQPWGFSDEQGVTTSWLTYLTGTAGREDGAYVAAIRALASRSGVDPASFAHLVSTKEVGSARRRQRRRELIEAFVAFCRVTLESPEGQKAVVSIRRRYGVDVRKLTHLPVGYYPTAEDVYQFLSGVGFSDKEISDSKVTRDTRLAGRLIVPWRDRFGRIQTVIAEDACGTQGDRPQRLFWRRGTSKDPFGMDLALRSHVEGEKDLILVENLWDVLYFRSQGILNVACLTAAPAKVTKEHFEHLSDCGVKTVTLAWQDSTEGHQRAFQAVEASAAASRTPRIYCLPPQALDDAAGPGTFSRLVGIGKFRRLVQQRVHGYRFAAMRLIEKYRQGSVWTDEGLIGVLNAALDFDAVVYQSPRALELDRFFWPVILDATGADWENLRTLLANRFEKKKAPKATPWPRRKHRSLMRDLYFAWHSNEIDRFEQLIIDAADRLRPLEEIEEVPLSQLRVWAEEPLATPVRPIVAEEEWDTAAVEEPIDVPIEPKPIAVEEPVIDEYPAVPTSIEELAYQIWQERGCPDDADQQCWYEAERRLGGGRHRTVEKLRAQLDELRRSA